MKIKSQSEAKSNVKKKKKKKITQVVTSSFLWLDVS